MSSRSTSLDTSLFEVVNPPVVENPLPFDKSKLTSFVRFKVAEEMLAKSRCSSTSSFRLRNLWLIGAVDDEPTGYKRDLGVGRFSFRRLTCALSIILLICC
eukprot:NODE_616_length_5966_cov_0.249531.p4 type:complete len:101 gc:universal NODE_616_length_5966_cov_0.249531:2800-3102(+)